jgi:hypothetical protein
MKKKKEKSFDVYVTRDTFQYDMVTVWPAELGIRKWHGCVEYGNANDGNRCDGSGGKVISTQKCESLYGFVPEKEEAYNVYTIVPGRIKIVKVDIRFSDDYTVEELRKAFIAEINSKDIHGETKKRAIRGILRMKRKDMFEKAKPTIIDGFRWRDTLEGFSFWDGIDDSPSK